MALKSVPKFWADLGRSSSLDEAIRTFAFKVIEDLFLRGVSGRYMVHIIHWRSCPFSQPDTHMHLLQKHASRETTNQQSTLV